MDSKITPINPCGFIGFGIRTPSIQGPIPSPISIALGVYSAFIQSLLDSEIFLDYSKGDQNHQFKHGYQNEKEDIM